MFENDDDVFSSNFQEEDYYCPYRNNYLEGFQECPYESRYEDTRVSPPKNPPPNFTPQQAPMMNGATVKAVDPGAIRPCTNRFSYIWLTNGQSFWAYLVFVGRTSAAGWRFRRNRWVYFGVDLKDIRSFMCY